MDIVLRILFSIALIGLIITGYRAINRLILWRARRRSQLEGFFTPGTPAILFFTTPDCVPCKTMQHPAIEKVKIKLGQRLQIIEVNASEQPGLAEQWGVLSVPTTFILDSQGAPRHVNHGVTAAEKLIQQLGAVA
ncbi:MAG: thioredoxin family protein [Anaerolineae bacterium]|nr:thioredoxin family protein [Anaerolineae bacterium]